MHPRIDVNPKILSGKPVIRGTRIPVEIIVRKLGEGSTVAEVLGDFPRLTEEDVRAALAFAADSLSTDEIIPLAHGE
jgi:uncharacterized protein (DUF433 family)